MRHKAALWAVWTIVALTLAGCKSPGEAVGELLGEGVKRLKAEYEECVKQKESSVCEKAKRKWQDGVERLKAEYDRCRQQNPESVCEKAKREYEEAVKAYEKSSK